MPLPKMHYGYILSCHSCQKVVRGIRWKHHREVLMMLQSGRQSTKISFDQMTSKKKEVFLKNLNRNNFGRILDSPTPLKSIAGTKLQG